MKGFNFDGIRHKRISSLLLAVILCVGFLLSLCAGFPFETLYKAKAVNNSLAFDKTNVLDDLRSSTNDDGGKFDLAKYPFDSMGIVKKPEIMQVVEYCYSFKANMRSNYALYIYFYNPQGLDINTRSTGNKIQIASKYNAKGEPEDYEKFDLKYCNKSEESGYKGLFYKFRVVDKTTADGSTILSRISDDIMKQQTGGVNVNDCIRRYDVSGAEIVESGKSNAVDYTIGRTYKYNGFVKGYGTTAAEDSTLKCSINELETVELDVQNTFYRTESASSLGAGHQNEVNSVYFAVPDALLSKYGKLQKIKAEWYEYKTQPIVITNKDVIYDKYLPHVGKTINNYDNSVRVYMYDKREQLSSSSSNYAYDWVFNVNVRGGDTFKSRSNFLPFWFKSSSSDLTKYTLPSRDLYNYIKVYNKSNNYGVLPIKDKTINADLFLDTVDSKRTLGYNEHNIDSDDTFDLLSYDSNHNWWDKLKDFGFWSPPATGEEHLNKSPIYEIKESDLLATTYDISRSLLVHENDVAGLIAYDKAAKDKTTFLFRFAQTDYYAKNLYIWDADNDFWACSAKDGMLAQQTVFFDFDIITLTFNRSGVYTVIAAVSSPIDIINSVTPPLSGNEENSWLKTLGMVLGLVVILVLVIIFMPFLKGLFSLVWSIITLPFRAIAGAMKRSKNKKNGGR